MKELKIRYQVARWISRKIVGVATPEEEYCLEKWRVSDEVHGREYEAIRKRLAKELREKSEVDIPAEWHKFRCRMPERRKISRLWYYAVAACVGMGLVIGFLHLHQSSDTEVLSVMNDVKGYKAVLVLDDGKRVNLEDTLRQTVAETMGTRVLAEGNVLWYDTEASQEAEKIGEHRIIVPRGGEYKLILADGTKVWLNSESELVYPVKFVGPRREVSMKGEVCFEVARNESQPFVVKTREATVTVLGTLFNMEAYPENQQVITTLVRGKVEIGTEQARQILAPDEQAVVEKSGVISVKNVYAADYVNWTNGIFHFTEASLEEIMTKLARWYNMDFFFANPSLKEAHFTLEIQRYDRVATILSKIEKTGRVHFKVNGNTVIIEE